ncbi:MAG: glutathione-disulfide reductase [Rhodospirillaceae bacterium]|nr:glutathione-disulfide reductase [Rhodospirillaceae bacterium]
MSGFDYDLFVIGAGSGGVRAARMVARTGARVAIAEESRVGGTCVIRGCIPKKILVLASEFREAFEDARGYGWSPPKARFDWASLIASKNQEVDRLNGVYKALLAEAGVELMEARARLLDPHTIEVGRRRVSARIVLIATGSWPVVPDTPGADFAITSNEAFELPELPRRIVIAGGGYIAVEFAGIFNGLGVEVVQLYRGEQILRGFDKDVRDALAGLMRVRGIDLRVHRTITRIEKAADGYRVSLDDGSAIETDLVMYATGRRPHTAGMGLEEVGVRLDAAGAVVVDAWSRSTVDNIYAIGDCTNRLNLTPVAIREAMAFADTVFGGRPWTMDYEAVPRAVFSQPPVGTVGLTEAEARLRHGPVDIYKTSFRPLRNIIAGRGERTLMKLVVDRASQRVLGAHMVGPDAPEIIQAIAIAVKMGATKQQFDDTVAVHPTAAEEWVTLRTREADPVAEAAE